jgi:ribosome biogenesis GTPase
MVQIVAENIKPVLVLNKADLDFDRQQVDESIRHLAGRIPVFFTTVCQSETIHPLRKSIAAGETVVFVGSSGVGKSSLINALCEKSLLLTSEISASTGKGKHTSTRREMVLMDGSGILIDTPGIREFGLTAGNPDSLAEMQGISDYTELCRFADCTHTNEPGCAVIEAVNSGLLDRKVYESYHKLQREAWHFTTSVQKKRKKEKSFSALIEEVKKRKEY